MAIIWDEDLYNRAYSGGYNRARYWKGGARGLVHHKIMLQRLEAALPQFNRNNDVLIIGCGYGFMMEVLVDLGATSVWGTDTSPYIQANKATEAGAGIGSRILDIDISDSQAKNLFNAAGAGGTGQNKGRFHWVVSEHVIESFNPATEFVEFNAFLDDMEGVLRVTGTQLGIVHLFAGLLPDDAQHNLHDHSLGITWLSAGDWMAYRPVHYWIDIHTWEVVGGI